MQLKKSISITRYTFVISGNAFAGLFVIKIAEDRFIFEWSLESFCLHLSKNPSRFWFRPLWSFLFLGKIENKERSGEYEDDCL